METIGINKGNMIVNISTMNVDTLRTMGGIDSLITNLENEIDISRIQETHNNLNGYIEKENYTIFFSGERNGDMEDVTHKSVKAGVAIIIKTKWKII